MKARLIVAVSASLLLATMAQAAEIKLLASGAIKEAYLELLTQFEKASGHKVTVAWSGTPDILKRVAAGEAADLVILSSSGADELIKQGKLVPGSRVDFAKSGIGVAVGAGAPKPDVSSVDAFKRALLTARSIAYLKEGQSGVYVAGVLERLGIAETIRSKVTLPETDIVSELVRRGEIELGIVVITQIVTTAGVALAGPLPSDIQSYVTFTGGISANSKSIDAAKDLMTVLRSPVAIGVMRSQGMERRVSCRR